MVSTTRVERRRGPPLSRRASWCGAAAGTAECRPDRARVHRLVPALGGVQVVRRAGRAGRDPFPVNERTMPHVYDMVGQLFEPVAAERSAADQRAARRGRSSRRRRPPPASCWAALSASPWRSCSRALGAAATRAAALRGRLANRADPRHRADGRHLDEPHWGSGVVSPDDRRLPDLLPGRDLHPARLNLCAVRPRSN